MLPCCARHKVAIGIRCVSGEGLEKGLNTGLRLARLPIPEGRGMRMENLFLLHESFHDGYLTCLFALRTLNDTQCRPLMFLFRFILPSLFFLFCFSRL